MTRYLVGLAAVLLALVEWPVGGSAHASRQGGASDLAAGLPQTVDGCTLEQTKLWGRRARIGLRSTATATVVGGVIVGASMACVKGETLETACWGPFVSGVSIGFSGAVGMIVTGAMLGKRYRKLRQFEVAGHVKRSRVQWDLARSRLEF